MTKAQLSFQVEIEVCTVKFSQRRALAHASQLLCAVLTHQSASTCVGRLVGAAQAATAVYADARRAPRMARRSTVVPNVKNPPKMRFKKTREID